MKNIHISIDGIKLEVPGNITVLQAAREAKIDIPTLCYLKGINEIGACRICLVEIKGIKGLQASCVYPVSEGLVVTTNSENIRQARRTTLELILSNHNRSCLTCIRNLKCELQALAEKFNIRDLPFEGEQNVYPIESLSPSIIRDNNKCILCRRCINVCKNIQQVSVIDTTNRGFKSAIHSPFKMKLSDTPCINCGQCITACPVGALQIKDDSDKVWDAINDKTKHVVCQVAPAVRVAIGEEFGYPIGSRVTKNLIGSLRKLGFDKIFDTNTAADLTIMEEGTELLKRLENNGPLPLITSCSPGWIKFCEHNFPEFIPNLSSCKSPQQMFGAILKTYYADKMGIHPKDIVVVSIMPCTAKKYEAKRKEMGREGYMDVDIVVTTREIARMIRESGIDFRNSESEHFDHPMGDASGAGAIFGATGGVMEAAIRTVHELVTGKPLEEIEINAVRGTEGIKEANVRIGDKVIRAAVAHGTGNAKKLMKDVQSGKKSYDFIEIMACPGGCVTGGGQPIQPAGVRNWTNLSKERAKAIYEEDRSLSVRKSHENENVKRLYKEFLGKPGSHIAHELLHTHYEPKDNYPEE
ncbi:MAG: NADH-dependent [FeFe] hydrogenase, group A6 [Clostridia bacterium]